MERKIIAVSFSLSQETYEQVVELAGRMKISESEVLREALKQYVASERRWQQIRRWGEETTKRLDIKDEDDVDLMIHEFRQEKSRY